MDFQKKKKKLSHIFQLKDIRVRLVVIGYTQEQSIDYFGTYSHKTKIAIIRAFIALFAIHGLLVHQMDVNPKNNIP